MLKVYITFLDVTSDSVDVKSDNYKIKDNIIVFDSVNGDAGFNLQFVKSFRFVDDSNNLVMAKIKTPLSSNKNKMNFTEDTIFADYDANCKFAEGCCKDDKPDYKFDGSQWWQAMPMQSRLME